MKKKIALAIALLAVVGIMLVSCCGGKPQPLDKYKGWRVVEKDVAGINYTVTLTKGDKSEKVTTYQFWYEKYKLGDVIGEEKVAVDSTVTEDADKTAE